MWANSHGPLKNTCRSACFMGDALGGQFSAAWVLFFFRGVAEQDGVRLSKSYYAELSLSSVLQWVIRSESWALWLPEQVMCDE